MKRILPALLAALAAFACACQTTPPPTTNGNGNVNANVSPPQIARANHEKEVTINIANSPAPPYKCVITVVQGSVKLDGRKEKVRWTAENECDAAENAQLIIDDFGKNNSDPSDKSPFGNDINDNKFIFDPIAKGDEGRLISKTGKGKPGNRKVIYKYTLKIVGTGGAELGKLDPEVEVSGIN